MISQTELTYFIEVANTLNLSRASERLGIAQPSLSVAMQRLEESIGAPLLIRHKRGVTLTQAGRQLLAHAKQLRQLWDEVKARAVASHQDVQGNFVLGCHPSLGLRYLAQFLPELLSRYAKLEVQLQHDISRKITEGVINLSIDIGIVVNPIKHPDLIMQKLTEDEVTLWHAPELGTANQCLQSGKAVLICDDELMQTDWLIKRLHKKGLKYSRIITSKNLEVIANLTLHGAGVGILPRSVAAAMGANKLQAVAKMPVYTDEIYLIYRSENREIKAVAAIVKAIKNLFANSL